MGKEDRLDPYQSNINLDSVLNKINGFLSNEFHAPNISTFLAQPYPLVFLFGCARSGTTLFFQWLAASGAFCYPNNLISRFYGAPAFGALIYKALYEYDFKHEICSNTSNNNSFFSDLGKTIGPSSPHEFWHFWRRYFHFGEITKLSEEELKRVDSTRLSSELFHLADVLKKPLVMKAMILNWHIPFLYSLFPKALFIHIERKSIFNGQSLLKSRILFFGDVKKWYSFKPPEYFFLQNRNPIEQVAGQVFFTNKSIREALKELPHKNVVTVSYESFCKNTQPTQEEIVDKLRDNGFCVDWDISPDTFQCRNDVRVLQKESREFKRFYSSLSESPPI